MVAPEDVRPRPLTPSAECGPPPPTPPPAALRVGRVLPSPELPGEHAGGRSRAFGPQGEAQTGKGAAFSDARDGGKPTATCVPNPGRTPEEGAGLWGNAPHGKGGCSPPDVPGAWTPRAQ